MILIVPLFPHQARPSSSNPPPSPLHQMDQGGQVPNKHPVNFPFQNIWYTIPMMLYEMNCIRGNADLSPSFSTP